ncbi:hypothetical protein MAFF301069_39550 (plasmid) [Ralstonia pseudosolanacearum]|nr:hypothetical protein MAFF301069_39550 [Ralstonia pseudosolanacearum]
MREGVIKDLLITVERRKAQIRARIEHPFHVIKNLFGHRKVRYKGLAKNTAQLFSLFGLANLVLAKRAVADQPWKHCALSAQSASGKTLKRGKFVLHWHFLPAMHKTKISFASTKIRNTHYADIRLIPEG